MKIVVLSQFYTPEPLPKPHQLAEGLRDRGHEVTVLTGFPNYPHGTLYPGYRMKPWAIETLSGVRVVRLPLYPDHSRSSVRRACNYLSFAAAASTLGLLLCGKADAMFVFDPPPTTGVAACLISRLRRVPFVYGIGDLWPESVVAAGMLKSAPAIALVEHLERAVCSCASAVAVVSPGMIDYLVRRGVAREKLHVLTDWADERVYRPVRRDAELAARLRMAGKFNVVFGGQVGLVQRLDTVIEAAAILRAREDIQFIIVGDGVEKTRLERESVGRGLANVRFVGRLPSEEMPRVYALADVALVHLSAHPVFRLSVPTKTYAYMGCGTPVLMAVDGVAADLIRESGAGLTCPPENPGAMAEAVLRFSRMSREDREAAGRRARELFVRQYARSVVLAQCEALLDAVAGKKTTHVPGRRVLT